MKESKLLKYAFNLFFFSSCLLPPSLYLSVSLSTSLYLSISFSVTAFIVFSISVSPLVRFFNVRMVFGVTDNVCQGYSRMCKLCKLSVTNCKKKKKKETKIRYNISDDTEFSIHRSTTTSLLTQGTSPLMY